MTLKKQSIRSNMTVYADTKLISKDELIKVSETWSEAQENLFRKCLKQGVFRFKVKGITYKIVLDEERSLIAIQGPKSAEILNPIIAT